MEKNFRLAEKSRGLIVNGLSAGYSLCRVAVPDGSYFSKKRKHYLQLFENWFILPDQALYREFFGKPQDKI